MKRIHLFNFTIISVFVSTSFSQALACGGGGAKSIWQFATPKLISYVNYKLDYFEKSRINIKDKSQLNKCYLLINNGKSKVKNIDILNLKKCISIMKSDNEFTFNTNTKNVTVKKSLDKKKATRSKNKSTIRSNKTNLLFD